jgi:hypothetical protein
VTGTIHVTGDEVRDHLEVPDVLCDDLTPIMQGGGPDQQILERNRYPAAGLLAGYPAGKQRGPRGERIDLLCRRSGRPRMPDGARGERPIVPAQSRSASSNNVTTDKPAAASPCASLSCAKIRRTLCFRRAALTSVLAQDNYSHERGVQGFRSRTICSISAAKSSSLCSQSNQIRQR